MLPIYVASALHHATKWKNLRRAWKPLDLDIISTWIDDPRIKNETTLTKLALSGAWMDNYRDLNRAKVVLLYGEARDNLRGALIESGIAMGMHKAVIVVGDHPAYGTWQYHPLVMPTLDLDTARAILETWIRRT